MQTTWTCPIEIEKEALHLMSWITITDVGEENLYFTRMDTGEKCFCKLLG